MAKAPTVPGGNANAVQYNHAGGFDGAANVEINPSTGNLALLNNSNLEMYGSVVIAFPLTTNAFFGADVGNLTLTGANNVGAGLAVLTALTTGQDNTAFGFYCGVNVTSGSANTILGWEAGNAITTESANTILGYAANVAAGSNNAIALGDGAVAGAGSTCVIGQPAGSGNAVSIVSGASTARAKLDLINHVAAQPVGIDQAAPGQSAPIREFMNSAGTVMSRVNPDGSIGLPTLADSAAANNSLYFSSTQSKLVFKDPSGTIHAI